MPKIIITVQALLWFLLFEDVLACYKIFQFNYCLNLVFYPNKGETGYGMSPQSAQEWSFKDTFVSLRKLSA